MRPVTVDVDGLDDLARALVAAAGRLEEVSAPVACAAAAAPGRDQRTAPAVRSAALRRTAAVGRLRAMATVVSAVGRRYVSVEEEIAAGFGRPAGAVLPSAPPAAVLTALLMTCPPQALQALLVSVPALAALVVDADDRTRPRPGPPAGDPVGADAAGLAALLGGPAAAVHRFLAGLPPARLQRLALLHPRLLGSTPAAPLAARMLAARVRIAADLDTLRRAAGAAPPGSARARVSRRIVQRLEWLHGEVVLCHPDGSSSRHPHQIVAFDPSGDGEIVEAFGDLARAQHLAVLVPGTGSSLDRYPGSMARATTFAAGDPSLAVLLWQGASFPDQPFDKGFLDTRSQILAAAYRDDAEQAGPRLAAEVAALHLTAPGPAADLTVLGHSYGGSVVGAAQLHGLDADRVVHIASAGAFPGADRAGRAAVYSMTALDDPIQFAQGQDAGDLLRMMNASLPFTVHGLVARGLLLTPVAAVSAVAAVSDGLLGRPVGGLDVGHGTDPDTLPGVVLLDTGRHDDGRLVSGHGDMFTLDSTAGRNLLAAMTGRPVHVLEPRLWAQHLEPFHLSPEQGRYALPKMVVDRSPWSDPAYTSPLVSTRGPVQLP